MRTQRLAWTCVIVLSSACAADAADLKIAVVDFHRAFMAYGRRDALQKELDQKKTEMDGKLSKLEDSLRSRQSDLETLKPGTPTYNDFQLKLIELEALVQVTRRQFELELEAFQRTHMQSLMGDMDVAVSAYAKEAGIHLVLSRFIADARIGGPHHVVLFAESSLDITDQIIARMNRAGAAGRKAGPTK